MKKNKKKNKNTISVKEIFRSWARTLVIATAVFVFIVVGAFMYLNNYTRHGERFTLPSFRGMSIEDAKIASGEMEINFDIIDSIYVASLQPGIIIDQYPKAGNFIKSGRRITITTNTFAPKNVKIPYITGYSIRQAKNKLVSVGLQISKLTYESDIAKNNILKQLYEGEEILPDSEIIVPVNSGVELIVGIDDFESFLKTPNLLGEPLYSAKGALWEEGLNITVKYDNDINVGNTEYAMVYKQVPYPGDSLLYGSNVDIYMTLDSAKVKINIQKEKNRVVNVEFLKKIQLKINDTLEMYENPELVIENGMWIKSDALLVTGRVDTVLVSTKYDLQTKLTNITNKLDSLTKIIK